MRHFRAISLAMGLLALGSMLAGCPTPGVPDARPEANFAADLTAGDAPLTVQFTDKSSPGTTRIRAWYWDFGDHSTSYLGNRK